MPPFWNQTYNPDPIFKVTGENATQSYGLNYQKHFHYKYDKLVFDGHTPEEFHQEYDSLCTNKSLLAIVVRDATKLLRTTSAR